MEEGIESGVVEEVLPRELYRVRLENGRTIQASLSGNAKRVTVQLIPGDRVSVSLSPRDPHRGRIMAKRI